MRFFPSLMVALCLGLLPSTMFAQELAPIATTPVEQDGKQLFINSFSGVPVMMSVSDFTGFNPKDGSIMWTVARAGGAAMSTLVDGEAEANDFSEIEGTPYIVAAGNVINVLNGNTVIDAAADERDLRTLNAYYTLADRDRILLELSGKGAIYLYSFDPFTGKVAWDVKLRDQSGLAKMATQAAGGGGDTDLQPRFNAAGDLIYANGKYLALIDTDKGEIKWNEKFDAGYIFTNEKGNRMVIAESRGGLGGMMAASMEMPGQAQTKERKFGKKIHLIDTETGQSVWKKEEKMDGNVLYVAPYDGGFMVVHDEGMNIYEFDAPKAEGRWKKDYKEKGVTNVEDTDEGLMVYFKNKRMLVDPTTGDEKWKKAEKLEKEPRGFLFGIPLAPTVERVGQHDVTFRGGYLTIGKGINATRYDFVNLLVEDDRIVIANPGVMSNPRAMPNDVELIAIELGQPEVKTQTLYTSIRKGADGIDKVDGGYFLYNDRAYHLLSYSPEAGFKEVRDEYYPDPTRGRRFLTGLATSVAGTAYGVSQTGNMLTKTAGGDASAYTTYRNRMNTMGDAADVGFAASERQINGRVDDDYAFFFARDKKEGATLFKVDKNTGEEVAKYRFDDLTPLYEIDYQNNRLYYQAKKQFKVFELEQTK